MDVAPTICMAATNDGSTPLSLPADSITIDSLLETVEKIHPIGFSPLLVLLSSFW